MQGRKPSLKVYPGRSGAGVRRRHGCPRRPRPNGRLRSPIWPRGACCSGLVGDAGQLLRLHRGDPAAAGDPGPGSGRSGGVHGSDEGGRPGQALAVELGLTVTSAGAGRSRPRRRTATAGMSDRCLGRNGSSTKAPIPDPSGRGAAAVRFLNLLQLTEGRFAGKRELAAALAGAPGAPDLRRRRRERPAADPDGLSADSARQRQDHALRRPRPAASAVQDRERAGRADGHCRRRSGAGVASASTAPGGWCRPIRAWPGSPRSPTA